MTPTQFILIMLTFGLICIIKIWLEESSTDKKDKNEKNT